MRVFLIAAMAALASSGACASDTLGSADQQFIRQEVAAKLIDPESSRFGDMAASQPSATGSVWVCGVVNSKNRLGGYTGKAIFTGMLWTHDGVRRFDLSGDVRADEAATTSAISSCRRNGVPPITP